MAAARKRAKILETRFMGLPIGILLIGIFLLLSEFTSIFDNLDRKRVV